MRIIILDDIVYKVSEKEFGKILKAKEEAEKLPFDQEFFLDEYLQSNKENYKNLGTVDFDFRL